MDKLQEAKIIAAVNKAVHDALEGADEVWLSSKGLLENFGMLSQDWLNRHGDLLPRECASVIVDGKEKCTRWAYPKHKINRMIQEGKLKGMVKVAKN